MPITLEPTIQDLAQNYICIYRHMTCFLTDTKGHFEDLGEMGQRYGNGFQSNHKWCEMISSDLEVFQLCSLVSVLWTIGFQRRLAVSWLVD